jgi:hypothetical protein
MILWRHDSHLDLNRRPARNPLRSARQQKVDSFLRFYVTPGVNHGGEGVTSSGAAVPSKVDLLGVLDAWADSGKAPDTLVQVSQETKPPFKILSYIRCAVTPSILAIAVRAIRTRRQASSAQNRMI